MSNPPLERNERSIKRSEETWCSVDSAHRAGHYTGLENLFGPWFWSDHYLHVMLLSKHICVSYLCGDIAA